MKSLGGVVLSMVLAVALFSIRAGAAEQVGTFRGEGVDVSVKYYAGGIGHSAEREAAEQSREYSVRVVFATRDRTFLANVGLIVTDVKGRVVFRIEGTGPLILLALPAGTYAFEGSYHGSTKRFQRVAVDPTRRGDVVFVFPE